MVALHFMYNNFGRVHQKLSLTPAMEAGIADDVWSNGEVFRGTGLGFLLVRRPCSGDFVEFCCQVERPWWSAT
jgi:hypothetical protein